MLGGLEHEFYFSMCWEFHNPNWLIFFRGVQTTNQLYVSIPMKWPISFLVILFVHHLSMGHLSHLYHIKLCLCLYPGGVAPWPGTVSHWQTLCRGFQSLPLGSANQMFPGRFFLLCFGARNCQGTKNTQKKDILWMGQRNPNHQLKTVVNIPLFIGFQHVSTIPNWWLIGFRWPIHDVSGCLGMIKDNLQQERAEPTNDGQDWRSHQHITWKL